MWISAYFPDVSFHSHTDSQNRELRSENVTFNAAFDGEYEKHIKTLIIWRCFYSVANVMS